MKHILYLLITVIITLTAACTSDKEPVNDNQDMKGSVKESETTSTQSKTVDGATANVFLNLSKGAQFDLLVSSEEKLTQELGDMKQTIKQLNSINYACEVIDAINNSFTIKVKYDRIIKEIDAGQAGKESFDSKKAKTGKDTPPQLKVLNNMIGQSYTVTLDRFGKVSSVKGTEKIIKSALANIKEDAQILELLEAGLNQEFGSDKLGDYYEKLLNYTDSIPRKTGDRWKKEYSIFSGLELFVSTQYELVSVTPEIATIKTKSKITDKLENKTQTVENIIISAEVKGEQNGTIEIDKKTGFIVNSIINQNISAKETRTQKDSVKNTITMITRKDAKYTITSTPK